MTDQKRFVLAMILSGLIMAGYYLFFAKPTAEQAKRAAEAELQRTQQKTEQVVTPVEPIERSAVVGKGERIKIDTPALQGSILLDGFRFDDVQLKNYKKTVKPDSENVTLLTPVGAEYAAEMFDNWVREGGGSGRDSVWVLQSGRVLSPQTPIVLTHTGDGFEVKRTLHIDDKFLITLDDEITNTSSREINLVRKGASRQYELPKELAPSGLVQQGPIAILDGVTEKIKYAKLAKKKKITKQGVAGWVGLTDQYWLNAVIPPQGLQIRTDFTSKVFNTKDLYEAAYTLEPITLASGKTITSTGYMFTGAKVHTLLKEYTDTYGISRLDLAVDYGRLGILAKPMSWALTRLGALTGNFGVGILALVLIIKILLFPLNNKAYASMAKMKAMQPKLKKLQERYGDDRMKLQQETMAMYRKEGVNPVAGCLPMIPQMFVFFALYKSLYITMEMRHAKFFGYLNDLSSREPISILNGFGLLHWEAVPSPTLALFALGPLALMYGITMAVMQTLNTPPQDKMQARIMHAMPLMFMFILGGFASGLLLYWVWNNILTIFQQYFITRKYKVETPLDKFLSRFSAKKNKTPDT